MQAARKRRVTRVHTQVWGECVHAPRPPPIAEADVFISGPHTSDDFLREPAMEENTPEETPTYVDEELIDGDVPDTAFTVKASNPGEQSHPVTSRVREAGRGANSGVSVWNPLHRTQHPTCNLFFCPPSVRWS